MYALHPLGIVEIPAHGFADPGLESLNRFPAEFRAAFRSVDCIATIVTRPVGNERDQGFVGFRSLVGRSSSRMRQTDRTTSMLARSLLPPML